jgi:hypothetical protein
MANFIVTYDLNGPRPTHQQMDDHLEAIGATRGRVLETVWYVGGANFTVASLRDHVSTILSGNDLLLVVECSAAAWNGMLIDGGQISAAWDRNA